LEVLNNIEKFNVITNMWTSLYPKLPFPVCKLAAIAIDKKNILMFGGVTGDMENTAAVFNFDSVTSKFSKKASMRVSRSLVGGVFIGSDKFIYAMNGTSAEMECERYSMNSNKWEFIPSYTLITNGKDINEFSGCIKYG
jgi:hypothetical protein